jgi:hypothetical protein
MIVAAEWQARRMRDTGCAAPPRAMRVNQGAHPSRRDSGSADSFLSVRLTRLVRRFGSTVARA